MNTQDHVFCGKVDTCMSYQLLLSVTTLYMIAISGLYVSDVTVCE